MLTVSSNIEIYTTMLGWIVFDIMWKMLSETGLVFLPFLTMLYRNMYEPYVSQDVKPAAITSFKRMKWELITSLIIITLFLLPSKRLTIDKIAYVTPPTLSNPSSNGLKFKKGDASEIGGTLQPKISSGVNVPIGWIFVMSIGNGINNYVLGSLPHPTDLRIAAQHLNSAYIKDPNLNKKLHLFANKCHIPAASKFHKNIEHFTKLLQNENDIDVDIEDDVAWMGSKVLTALPGLYKNCSPSPNNNCEVGTGFSVRLDKNITYCDIFWADIRHKIIESAKKDTDDGDEISWWGKGKLAVASLFGSQAVAEQEDALVRQIIDSNGEHRTGLDSPEAAYKTTMFDSPILEAGANIVKSFFTSRKLENASIESGFIATLGQTGLPMIRAALLMCIIWFIPLFFLVAGYHNVERLFQLILAIFTVQMLTLWGNLGYWVDQTLANLLYGDTNGFWEYVKGHVTGPHRLMLDVITTMFYVVIPGIFGLVMVWAGSKASQSISGTSNAMSNSSQPSNLSDGAQDAMDKGKSTATNSISQGASKADQMAQKSSPKYAAARSLFPNGNPKS